MLCGMLYSLMYKVKFFCIEICTMFVLIDNRNNSRIYTFIILGVSTLNRMHYHSSYTLQNTHCTTTKKSITKIFHVENKKENGMVEIINND